MTQNQSPTPENGKIDPHDIAAEEATLGSLLIDGDAMVDAIKLQPSDFYHEPHQWIFKACRELWNRKETINRITIAQELDRNGKLEASGGVAYFFHLISIVPTPLDIADYVGIVARLSVSRKAIELGERITKIGFSADPSQEETLTKISNLVSDFRKNNAKYGNIFSTRESLDLLLEVYWERQKKIAGMRWGYWELDDVTAGIHPGELVVVGARPSIGKSQFMFDAATHLDLQGKRVLFVSAEMSMEHIMERKLSQILQKDIGRLRKGDINEADEKAVLSAAGEMSEYSNICYYAGSVSSNQIYAEAARLKDLVGIDVIFIDYLQKLNDCYGERENQNVRVGRAMKTLKDITTDLHVPVIVASQLSRDIEHRAEDDRMPNLSDLRDSGSIEQDADIVLLLYRYMGNNPEDNGGTTDPKVLWVKQAKHRQIGAKPAVPLLWDSKKFKYVNFHQYDATLQTGFDIGDENG
jgi:replicative DNA helicase